MPVAASGTAASPATPRQGRSILVVDDNPANLEFAVGLFGRSGYRVATADGMSRGLALARAAPPDLILSDVIMGEGSGYEFIQAVKSDAQLSAIPFVLITSTLTGEAERRKGLALGAAQFLFRPIEPQDLLREIDACVDGPAQR
jgi:CheY-like chemotaxis protein